MKKLNLKLLVGVAALTVLLGVGTIALHSFQSDRIARALLWQAQHAEEEARLDLTAKFLARYLELKPGANEERAHLGRVLADKKMATTPRARQRALFILEQVVTREPERWDSRRQLVRVALDLQRYQSALEHLSALQKAAPKDSEVLEMLGRTYEAMNKPEEAKDSYQKSIDADPHNIAAYERLALLLRRHPDAPGNDRRRNAEAIMDRLVANNERSVPARLARWNYFAQSSLLNRVGSLLNSTAAGDAKVLSRLDQPTRVKFEQAGQDLARALELAPDDLDVLLAASEWEMASGGLETARAHLGRGQRLHPEDARLYRHRAALDLLDRKPADAVACLRAGIKATTGRNQAELRWTLANLLLDQGQTEEARQETERLAKVGFAPPALDYLNGRLLSTEKDWAQAARIFERSRAGFEALSLSDREVELYLAQIDLFVGRCYDQLNDSGRKMAAFTRLVAREPASSAARLSLASAYITSGRLDEALEQYRQALELPDAPKRVAIDYARLLILRTLQRGQSDWAPVRDAVDRAAKAQPDSFEIPLLRAEVLVAQNELTAARKLLEEARARQPKQIEFHTALAGLSLRQGDEEGALRILQQAREQAGDSVELRLALAGYWANSRDTKGARQALAGLADDLNKFPHDDRVRLLEQVALASNRVGDSKQALRRWGELANDLLFRNDLRVQFALVELALQVGDDELARRGLEQVKRIEAGQGSLWHLGEALRLMRLTKDPSGLQQARGHLDAAAAARPGWIAVHVARAELEERAGRSELALKEYREAIDLGDRSPQLVKRRVELLNKLQRFREAADVIRQLKKQGPLSEELRRLEVDVALHNHESANAVQRALELVSPDSTDYRDALWLGHVLSESGLRPDEAEDQLRRATKLAPHVPETWVVLVEFLARRHRLDQATAEIDKALRKLPKDQADLALAQCYEAVGNFDAARRHYEAALAARPKDAAVLRGYSGFCVRSGQLAEAERHLRRLNGTSTETSAEDAAWARRNLAWVRAATGGREGLTEALALVGISLDNVGKPVLPARNSSAEQFRQEQQARARVLAVHNRRAFRSQAIAILEDLNREESLGPDDLYLLAQLHDADGNWPRARQEFRDLLTAQADSPAFLAHFVQSLIKHGDLEEARSCLERLERLEQARKVEPGSFGTARLRAGYLEARGDPDKALELLRDNAARKDARPEEILLLVGYLAGRKQVDEALGACEQAWKTCSVDAAARASLATLRSGRPTPEQIARVERWLLDAGQKTPTAIAPLLYLAELRDLQGQYGEAEAIYRKVLERDRANATALNNLAWLLAQKSGGAGEALDLINRAIDAHGPAPGLLDTRATVHLAQEQAVPAIKDLEEANAESPAGPRLFQLARAHLKAKDRAAASKVFAEAKRLGFNVQQLHPLQRDQASRVAGELESR